MVGCPVTTIDWYARSGRIRKRPSHGARPSLSRSSVEEFAGWWRQAQKARVDRRLARGSRVPATVRRRGERRRARDDGLPRGLPDPGVWMTVTQAADLLEVSPATVVRLARSGSCPALRHSGRWWVDREAVAVVAEDRSRWVSFVDAGRLAGCSATTVGYAVRRGWIRQREVANRALPSLERSSVLEFAERRAARAWARARTRTARAARKVGPPADGDVWFDTRTTALVLRISVTRVGQLARCGRLPCTDIGGRRWFRRSDIECIAAARVFLKLRADRS